MAVSGYWVGAGREHEGIERLFNIAFNTYDGSVINVSANTALFCHLLQSRLSYSTKLKWIKIHVTTHTVNQSAILYYDEAISLTW